MKPYPKYKPSGIPWLRDVPEHWNIERLKFGLSFIESGTSVNAADVPAAEGQLGVLKTSCVYTRIFRPEENKTVMPEDEPRVSCPVRLDSVIVSRMNTPELVGAAGLVRNAPENIFLPDRLWQVITDQDKLMPAYLYWFTNTQAYLIQVQSACSGSSDSMQNLGQDKFRNFITPLSPPDEQTAIAAYLDIETARIDTLVAEKEKLFELLGEYRQSVITEVVTKGLNPDVPMKSSGVPWLGKTPAHWVVSAMKRFLSEPLMYGANEAANDETPNNPRFVRITDIDAKGELRDETFRSLPPEIAAPYRLQEGDILLARSGATVGKSFLYRSTWGECCFAGYLIRARLDPDKMTSDFFYYLCQSDFYWQFIRSEQVQATIPNVSAERYANLVVSCPPPSEQSAIAAYLDTQTTQIDGLIAHVQKEIELLKELRSATITDAVLGRIDLRDYTKKNKRGDKAIELQPAL